MQPENVVTGEILHAFVQVWEEITGDGLVSYDTHGGILWLGDASWRRERRVDAAAVAASGSAGAAGVGGTPVAQGPGPDPVRPNAEACGSSDFAVRFQSIM